MAGFFTDIFMPFVGMIICNFMWYSPIPTIIKIREKRELGNINPIPFYATVMNCIGWTIYGLIQKNIFVFMSNITGILSGLFNIINCLIILSLPTKNSTKLSKDYEYYERLFLFVIVFWFFMLLIMMFSFSYTDDNSLKNIQEYIGTLCCVFTILYYFAPLSSMKEMIKKKDASEILYLPLLINTCNSLLWLFYAFFINDMYLLIPNLFGIVLCTIQFFLKNLYKDNEKKYNTIEETKNILHNNNNNNDNVLIDDEEQLIDVSIRSQEDKIYYKDILTR